MGEILKSLKGAVIKRIEKKTIDDYAERDVITIYLENGKKLILESWDYAGYVSGINYEVKNVGKKK